MSMPFHGLPLRFQEVPFASGTRSGTVRVWDMATGTEIGQLNGHTGSVLSLAFSRDATRLVSGSSDTTGLVWDMKLLTLPDPTPKGEYSRLTLDDLWDGLAVDDPATACKASWTLIGRHNKSVAFLKGRLKASPGTDQARLSRLIDDLDSDKFAVRDAATEELHKLGAEIQPLLQRALSQGQLSVEARRSVTSLLDKLHGQPLPRDIVRRVRAIEILEFVGSDEAQQLLDVLSQGSPFLLQTENAKAALGRLRPANEIHQNGPNK